MAYFVKEIQMTSIYASIVLYKHNFEDISITLNCLLESEYVKKIILVDNDLSDWAENLNHEKVIYLKSEGNFGFGYGHNLAIQSHAFESDFYLVCNPDIKFEQSEFSKLVQFAENRSEGLFLPKIIYSDGKNQFGARLLPSPLNLFARRFSKKMAIKQDKQYLLQDFEIDKPIFAPYLSGCFMFFKSEVLLALNGFDEQYFMYMEDVDLSRRCASEFGTVYYPHSVITHFHERASHNNKILLKAHIKSAFQYFNKWGWIYDSEKNRLNRECLEQFLKNKF